MDNNVEDTLKWKKVLLLATVLTTPSQDGIHKSQRCKWIKEDDWSHFTLCFFKRRNMSARSTQSSPSEELLKKKIKKTTALLKVGEISRAYETLQSVAPVTELPALEKFQKLQELHPDNDEDRLPELPDNLKQLQLSEEVVWKTIKKSKRLKSTCDIFSVTNEFLQMLVGQCNTPLEQECLERLTWIFNKIVNGQVPKDVMHTLRSTQGAAISKKKPGAIRPLGLRDGLLNVALKVALNQEKDAINKLFTDVNYALAGTKKMDELITLTGQSLLHRPDHDRIFIDASNAFNQISRRKAFAAACQELPQLATIIHCLYDSPTSIWMNKGTQGNWTTFLGKTGCIQGDPFGPLMFGLGTLDVYKNVINDLRDVEDAFFGTYSDDGTITAPHDNAIEAFKIYETQGAECGLQINYAIGKTEVLLGYCTREEEVQERIAVYQNLGLPPENIHVHPGNNNDKREDYGYVHLGIAVGTPEFKTKILEERISGLEKEAETLNLLKDPQQQWVFMLWVLRQKFSFHLRHYSPTITYYQSDRIDNLLRRTFTSIIGHEVDDDTWTQACLPIKNTGFNIGTVKNVIVAAFGANVQETREELRKKLPSAHYLDIIDIENGPFQDQMDDIPPIQHDIFTQIIWPYRGIKQVIKEAEEMVLMRERNNQDNTQIGDQMTTTHSEQEGEDIKDKKNLQHAFTKKLSDHDLYNYLDWQRENNIPVHNARLLSSYGSMSGGWLLCIPKDKSSIITPEVFRTCCLLRLGLPIPSVPTFCYGCRDRTDSLGTHLFSCTYYRQLLTQRHDAIIRDLKELASEAGVIARDKHLTIFRIADETDGQRPDLLLEKQGTNGRDLLLDITVSHPTCSSYVGRACKERGHTIRKKRKEKNNKYLKKCEDQGACFSPLPFESFGLAGKEVLDLVSSLVKKASESLNIDFALLLSYWKKRMSTTLQVYTAKFILEASVSKRNPQRRQDIMDSALLETYHVRAAQ